MVRVSNADLVAGLRQALRACDLEGDIREAERARRLAAAQLRACDFVRDLPALDGRRVLDELPLTAAGDLHEEAFHALVEKAAMWSEREQVLARWAGQDSKGSTRPGTGE